MQCINTWFADSATEEVAATILGLLRPLSGLRIAFRRQGGAPLSATEWPPSTAPRLSCYQAASHYGP